jgi:hypothetical protein
MDGCLPVGSSIISPELMLQQIDVSVVTKHSSFVCKEAEHQPVYALALITLVVMAALYPLAIVTFLSARLRYMVQQSQRRESVKMVVLRAPCVRWKGSWCVRYSAGLCSPTCREPKRTPATRVNEKAQILGDESIFSRQATQVDDFTARKAFIVDSDDLVREADKDPYFAPLAGSELLPSGFYFMQLNQITAVILSISFTYLDGYEYAWWRFLLNSVAILGLLGLLVTTKPYRETESFSLHVQISLLLVSYIVTLTGFIGILSSPPGPGILPGNLNSTANYTLLGEASISSGSTMDAWLPPKMNDTSPVPLTEATNVRPSLQ